MKRIVACICLFYFGLTLVAKPWQHPMFSDYPVKEIFHGSSKPVDLKSHPKARQFRTVLHEASMEKPSFAGYYIVAEWGCGTYCHEAALIDARTGAVYFAPFTTSMGNRHHLDSRLLMADAPEDLAIYQKDNPIDPVPNTSYW